MNRTTLIKIINDNINQTIDYRWFPKKQPDAYNEVIQFTLFLSSDAKLQERIFCIKNSIITNPLCKACSTSLKFRHRDNKYPIYCCRKCSGGDIVEAKKETCLARYGVDNVGKIKEIRKKAVATTIGRHGVIGYQDKELREKAKKTLKRNHGVDNPFKISGMRERIKQTMNERYGVDSPMESDIIKNKSKQTLMSKYGVDNYNKLQTKEVQHLLDDHDWIHDQYVTQKKPAKQIAIELDIDGRTIATYLSVHNIETNKIYNTSINERQLLDFITINYDGMILSNDRQIIKPMELDIVLPEEKIAIEYCGLYWHSHLHKPNKYHLKKLEACNKAGYRLITIFEDEWIHQKTKIQNKLLYILKLYKGRIDYARNCYIEEITSGDRKEFMKAYHIQNDHGCRINLGLFSNSDKRLVAVLALKDMKNGNYDLVRFASSNTVVGGFSKLLTYFKRNYDWNEIYTFADRRWSEGNLYLKTGFEVDKVIPPDYSYIDKTQRIHKFNFRHKNLKQKLGDKYNPALSEFKNTENNGINRIYNCGLIKFIIKNS